jgi:hypothetical protein
MRPLIARRLVAVVDVVAALVLVLSGLVAIVATLLVSSWSAHFQSRGDPAEEALFVGVGVGLVVLGSIRPLASPRRAWLLGAVIVTGVLLGPISPDGMFLMLFLAFVLGVLLSTRRQLEEVIARENVLDSSAS